MIRPFYIGRSVLSASEIIFRFAYLSPAIHTRTQKISCPSYLTTYRSGTQNLEDVPGFGINSIVWAVRVCGSSP